MSDNVNHPEHYAGEKECIDVMLETQGEEAVKGFCVCNAIKYLYRHRQKGGVEDVKKAVWYLNKYIELCESKESFLAQCFTKEAMGVTDDKSGEKPGENQLSQLAKDLVQYGIIGHKKALDVLNERAALDELHETLKNNSCPCCNEMGCSCDNR